MSGDPLAVERHVDSRKREYDLAQVVTRYRDLLGIGLDEATAGIIRHNVMTVIGQGRIARNAAGQLSRP